MLVKLMTLKRSDCDEPIETLSLGRVYEVLALSGDWYRLLSDNDRPYLYPPGYFEVVDPTEPDFWVEEWFEGEKYASPPEWKASGFWEDLFEDDPGALETFSSILQRRYPWTCQERGVHVGI